MANNIAYSNRLEFTQGSSFKEYNVAIITAADDSLDLFNVNFSYGRIGSALQTGTKNASPVTLSEAESIAQKLIKSKMKKGYVSATIVDNIPAFQSGQSSTSNAVAVKDISFDDVNNPAAQHQVVPSAVSQMIDNLKSDPQYTPVFAPQLLNTATPEQAIAIIEDGWLDTFFVQIKADGERRPVSVKGGVVEAYNKRGCITALPETMNQALIKLAGGHDLFLDCEDMGAHGLFIFDVLDAYGERFADKPFADRAVCLDALVHKIAKHDLTAQFTVLKATKVESGDDLHRYIAASKISNEEGIVLRHGDAPYKAGRPSKLGSALKLKNKQSASVVVTEVYNDKLSVSMGLRDGDNWVDVGNILIPASCDRPEEGDVIEVEYLYVHKAGGALYQPVFKCVRNHEVDPFECTVDQLVYRKTMAVA